MTTFTTNAIGAILWPILQLMQVAPSGGQFGTEGKVQNKKKVKKLTSVSFMYVCVAENAELLVFFAPSP